MRADARRNRERIVRAAGELVERDGVAVPLDDVARAAGVGPGTLHRHFPTKEALLAAVVVDRMEDNVATIAALAGQPPERGTLQRALLLLLDEGERSTAMKAALAGTGFDLRTAAPDTAAAFRTALAGLVEQERSAGGLRDGVRIDDVLAVLTGAFAAIQHTPGPPEQSRRLAGMVFAGLFPPLP